MRRIGVAALLLMLGLTAISGCAIEHRRDGGITFRPIHWW